MSRIEHVTVKCSVCGNRMKQVVLCSSNQMGAPDLDLRPAPMMRDTMNWWVQECTHCGYVSGSIEDKSPVSAEWLRSDRYITCDNTPLSSKLAERFYKQYMISLKAKNVKKAFYAILHAAWACDDAWNDSSAIHCRKLALKELDQWFAQDASRMKEDMQVVRADLLRRTGEFDALIEEYQDKSFSSDLINRIITFEIALAKKQDDGRYTVGDVHDPAEQ